jgi:peptidoglycan hydrolase CwlO-like protein
MKLSRKMTNTGRIAIFIAAFIGMGMSLPSCPGDKAMQQQIDMLNQSNQDMTRKLQNLDTQIKGTGGDIIAQKSLITQLATTVGAQKDAIDNLYNQIKSLEAKMATPAPKAKKKPVKKKK